MYDVDEFDDSWERHGSAHHSVIALGDRTFRWYGTGTAWFDDVQDARRVAIRRKLVGVETPVLSTVRMVHIAPTVAANGVGKVDWFGPVDGPDAVHFDLDGSQLVAAVGIEAMVSGGIVGDGYRLKEVQVTYSIEVIVQTESGIGSHPMPGEAAPRVAMPDDAGGLRGASAS